MNRPDFVSHVAVGQIEAGQDDGLQLRLRHDVGVHAVTDLK